MKNKKELIVCLFTIITLILTITNVFATSQDINNLLGNTNDDGGFSNITSGGNNNVANNVVNNVANNVGNNSAVNSTTNKVANNTLDNNVTLPQTGLDSSLTIMIIVCGASIIYAYTRIRKSDI